MYHIFNSLGQALVCCLMLCTQRMLPDMIHRVAAAPLTEGNAVQLNSSYDTVHDHNARPLILNTVPNIAPEFKSLQTLFFKKVLYKKHGSSVSGVIHALGCGKQYAVVEADDNVDND